MDIKIYKPDELTFEYPEGWIGTHQINDVVYSLVEDISKCNNQDLIDAPTASQGEANQIILERLEKSKEEAYNKIDNVAEQIRLKYITDGVGQAQTYFEKAEEAADFAAAGYPSDLSNYPFIQADVDAYQITAKEVADNILAKRSEWIHIGSQVERERLMGKRLISNATDEDEVDVILQDTIDSLNQL